MLWLKDIQESSHSCASIEELDELAITIKKNSKKFGSHKPNESLNSSSRKGTHYSAKGAKILNERGEKLKTYKIWSEEKLEKVLYEIENISYKLAATSDNIGKLPINKKKRITTEVSEQPKVSGFLSGSKYPGVMVKSGSNSRFNSGRKPE